MNLRQVRKKTKSIRNVKKITKAMQLVSAIKMKKAQAMETEGRPYRDTLTSVIERLLPGVDESSSSLLNESLGDTNKSLVIFVSSNKGLAGSFHVNLFRFIAKNDTDFAKTDFITVGTKGSQFVSRMGGKVLADFSKGRFLNEVSAIFSLALEKFLAGEYKRISILYNKYISAFRSEPTEETLLPMRWNDRKDAERALKLEYTIEPSPQEIIEPLIKSYLEEKVRGALVSSDAVEHASRMLAMKNATDNATDIIYNLTLIGNKLRQEKITNELLDMITAKESVG
ncbi:ATP synthase F1 subunit gamma, partial [Candidatus Roizmanbacteria bacterium RIFCSPHIGHO2_01_FULL_39_8]